MNDERKELEERIRKLTDEEVVEMVLAKSSEYTQEALSLAKAEADKRGGLKALREKIDRERELRVKQEKMERELRVKQEKLEPEQREQHIDAERGHKDVYHFKTLLSYGKFMSGIGWFMVVLGACAVILTLSYIAVVSLTALAAVLVAILVIAFGIGMVASGQLISCFVSIEKNTRTACEILKQKSVP